jgi:hypothetical protein
MLDVLRYRLIFIAQSIYFYNCSCNLFEIYDFSCERECYVIENNEIGIRFLVKNKNERASLLCIMQHIIFGEVFK